MRELWRARRGGLVFEAATFNDDRDDPVAEQGPISYRRSEPAAEAFARLALIGRMKKRPGGFWYRQPPPRPVGRPIGDANPRDHAFDPEPDWSRTILADEVEPWPRAT